MNTFRPGGRNYRLLNGCQYIKACFGFDAFSVPSILANPFYVRFSTGFPNLNSFFKRHSTPQTANSAMRAIFAASRSWAESSRSPGPR